LYIDRASDQWVSLFEGVHAYLTRTVFITFSFIKNLSKFKSITFDSSQVIFYSKQIFCLPNLKLLGYVQANQFFHVFWATAIGTELLAVCTQSLSWITRVQFLLHRYRRVHEKRLVKRIRGWSTTRKKFRAFFPEPEKWLTEVFCRWLASFDNLLAKLDNSTLPYTNTNTGLYVSRNQDVLQLMK